jgi:hypothetical protein
MTATPVIPQAIRSRLGWAITDAWVMTRRDLAHWVRQPGTVIASTLLFPVMIVLMFGYLLGGAMTVPGGGDYRAFLMPGMFAMTMVFGIGATLTVVSTDAARGSPTASAPCRWRHLPSSSGGRPRTCSTPRQPWRCWPDAGFWWAGIRIAAWPAHSALSACSCCCDSPSCGWGSTWG